MKTIHNQNWVIDIAVVDLAGYVPEFLDIRPSALRNAGLGVFARLPIAKDSFLGNYMGRKTTAKDLGNPYLFASHDASGRPFYIDAADPVQANFARYMNCATSATNENVVSIINRDPRTYFDFLCMDGYIMFFAKRDIAIGEELLYDYGEDYRQRLAVAWGD